jgi:AcrR family transcriptional regulator
VATYHEQMTSRMVRPARRSQVDDRIFAATLDLLRTRGPLAVSVESVAAASGVAKTTIYRRFENRASLLTAVITASPAAVSIPTDLTTRETLGWVLRHASDTIERVIGRGTVAAVLANEDPEFTTLLLGMIRSSTRPLRDNLRARAAAGEIPAEVDIELVMSMLLGVVIAELIRGRVTDDAWVESVLALIWPAFAASGVDESERLAG